MGTRGFKTKRHLEDKAGFEEGSKAKEAYDIIQRLQQRFQFSYFVTYTTASPATDYVDFQEANRKLKRFIKRHYYRRREKYAPLKFLFFIEAHDMEHQGQKKYHVHFLMSEVTNVLHDPSERPNPNSFQEKDRLPIVGLGIEKCMKRLRSISSHNRFKIGKFEVQSIYDQDNLCDYLSKELQRSPEDIFNTIDIQNSDLIF